MTTKTPIEVLKQLIDNVESTGGLIRFTDGNLSPKADPSWLDLGWTIKAAEETLIAQGEDVTLSIEDVEHSSRDIDEF